MEKNNINIKKIEEIMTHPSVHVSSGKNEKNSFMTLILNYKKPLLIIFSIIVILGVLIFFFKDILFKEKIVEPIGPKNYQEAIDQSFKEGYKTDYTYNPETIKAIQLDNTKSQATVKNPSSTAEQALRDRINN